MDIKKEIVWDSMKEHYQEIADSINSRGMNYDSWIEKKRHDDNPIRIGVVGDRPDDPWYVEMWQNFWWPIERKLKAWHYKYYMKPMQRLRSGYPDEQVFNFYSFHSKYVLPRLKDFQENLSGWPVGIAGTEAGDEANAARWEEVIGEMVWAFEFADFEYNEYCDDWAHIRFHNGMRLFGQYYFSLWD